MILPTNCFQSWDLILFRQQSRRYVEHLFKCEICRIRNGMTTVLVIISNEYRWFHCHSHKHSPNHTMFFSIFCTIWNYFLFFSHLIFTKFKNDLDSVDNSNSASSFPMTNCWGRASAWGSLSSRPDLSRTVSSFLTDYAVPSRRISSWEKSSRTFRVILQ